MNINGIQIDGETYRTEDGLVLVLVIEIPHRRNARIERYFLVNPHSYTETHIHQISAEMAFRLVRRKR